MLVVENAICHFEPDDSRINPTLFPISPKNFWSEESCCCSELNSAVLILEGLTATAGTFGVFLGASCFAAVARVLVFDPATAGKGDGEFRPRWSSGTLPLEVPCLKLSYPFC